MRRVLLLNADWTPIKTINWHAAVNLIIQHKVSVAEVIENKFIRSPSLQVKWPSVIVLKNYIYRRGVAGLNRKNLLARDNFTCQYCGSTPEDKTTLTMDHVVPRAHAKNGYVILPWNQQLVKVHNWRNITLACYRCNNKKRNRTPVQAKMKLNSIPAVPRLVPIIKAILKTKKNPPEWEQYLE